MHLVMQGPAAATDDLKLEVTEPAGETQQWEGDALMVGAVEVGPTGLVGWVWAGLKPCQYQR